MLKITLTPESHDQLLISIWVSCWMNLFIKINVVLFDVVLFCFVYMSTSAVDI